MIVDPPWTAVLTSPERSLILFGLVTTLLALSSTLIRARLTTTESHGVHRSVSLTANAVVALAAASYLALVVAFLVGYDQRDGSWVPNAAAQLAWSVRYMDWFVTVPLLVAELLAVSRVAGSDDRRARVLGVALALGMPLSGYLGAVVIADGRDFTALAVAGAVGAACFVGLYALVLSTFRRTAPRLPVAARPSYQSAVVVLLVTWLAYPVVYGLQGITAGGAWAVTGQLVLCVADTVAKIGFGSLLHRTAVLRSRADDEAEPAQPRPRRPQADAVWVEAEQQIDPDFEPPIPLQQE
ncbi:bacteriorhodopsin [uncultured Amnibacterium sp.]|uniref:bacteriorhodopsin n=1 Tax=uncultured Amnibacterium sp. TaxID=1631851 RepID=UPI0035CBE998